MSAAPCPTCRKGPLSPPDHCAPADTDAAARRRVSLYRTFVSAAACTAAALFLSLSAAPALATDFADDGVRLREPGEEIVHPEGAVARILSLPPGDRRLSGPDTDRFRIEAGTLSDDEITGILLAVLK